MGADRAIHVHTEERIDAGIQPLLVARVLQQIAEKEKVDVIILGKQSIDDDFNHTGQMTAGLLGWPQGTFASKIEIGDKECRVEREIDTGIQALKMPTPCVLTCDLRLNEPRNASIKQIMAAKKKPVDTVELKSMELGDTPALKVMQVDEPPKRKGGIKVESVDELLNKLKTEAKVL